MSILQWDAAGERQYEAGVERGVLYPPDKTPVPWNGLISVEESFDRAVSPIYYDGMKISDEVELGDFAATLSAMTYPDEFLELEGMVEMKSGVYASDQRPQMFGLSYRTKVGNDVLGQDAGYKIHLLYNVTAIPSSKSYTTVSDQLSATQFQWNITAVPEEVPGIRPTAHFIINSLETDPWLMEELEEILYGTETTEPYLIPLPDLVTYIRDWFRIKITDNGDGTWTAETKRDGAIQMLPNDMFEIDDVNAAYSSPTMFTISDS